jgi:hypothetical protein
MPAVEVGYRDLVALHVERIVLHPRHIALTLRVATSVAAPVPASAPEPQGQGSAAQSSTTTVLQLPWTPANTIARQGIAWEPSAQGNLNPATGEVLLTAIARARLWMNDLINGKVSSFEEIAR